MTKLFVDFETASAIDLKKVGLRRYMAHPSTMITHTAILREGEKLPSDDTTILTTTPDIELVAHNVGFERAIINRFFPKADVKKWTCTASLARQLRAPGDLKKSAKYFNAAAKNDDGAALMKRVCKLQVEEPKKKTGTVLKVPYTWVKEGPYWRRGGETVDELMQAYCEQDAVSCRALYQAMQSRLGELGDGAIREAGIIGERMTDQANTRGMRIDMAVLDTLIAGAEDLEKTANEHCEKHLGGFKASQVTAIKRFCIEKGLPIAGVGAPDVARIKRTEHKNHALIPHLEMRNKLVKSSLRRLPKLKEQVYEKRLYDTLVYCGAATTGRWAGRGFQPQNLPRPVSSLGDCKNFIAGLQNKNVRPNADNADQLAGAIRTLLLPEEGQLLCSADLSQIELRLSVYHAGSKNYSRLLETGGDVYLDFAKALYENPALTKESDERAICKIAVLSLQYGAGARQFKDYLMTSNDKDITDAEASKVVSKFREFNPGLVDCWKAQDRNMMMHSVQGRELHVKLRSGRTLNYGKVKKRDIRYPDGKVDNAYTYWNGMFYKKLWGGTIYQNIIQAEARDVFLLKLADMEKYKEYTLMTTVHDEVVFSIPKDDTKFETRWNAAGAEAIKKHWPGLALSSDVKTLPCYYK